MPDKYFLILSLFSTTVQFSLQGQTLFFSSCETGTLYSIDLQTCTYDEICKYQSPPEFIGDPQLNCISAFVFHPNGKIYGNNTRYIVEIDPKTGIITPIFRPKNYGDFIYWLGMTVDSQNRILIGYFNLNFYDPVTGKYTENPGGLELDNFTIYNNKLLANRRENFQYVDINRSPYSLIDEFQLPGLSEMTAITTFNTLCEGEVIYGFNHNLEHKTNLYKIDPIKHQFDTLCTIDINFVTAMGSPFLYYDPKLQPDLDIDNSSGHTGNGYFTKWNCINQAALTDVDLGLKVCKDIDSIIIESNDATPLGELFQKKNSSQYLWQNNNQQDTTQIKNWLKNIIVTTQNSTKAQIIKTYFFAGSDVAETWTIIDPFDDPFKRESTQLKICNTGEPVDLNSLLGISEQEVVWTPNVAVEEFIPGMNKPDQFIVIRKDDFCPDTLYVTLEVLNPPDDWQIVDQLICHRDSFLIEPHFPEFSFRWLQPGSGTMTIKQPGEYPYEVSNNFCQWTSAVMVKYDPDCLCPIYIPNAFTPNDDGLNDYFELFADNCLQFKSISIFDCWGNERFNSTSNTRWDGSKAPSGVYIYNLQYFDTKANQEKTIMGEITLIR